MGKRTLRKNKQGRSKRRLNKSTLRKTNQRRNNQRKTNQRRTMRKYVGGDEAEFKSVMLSILNDTYIPFLPTTVAINDKDQRDNYLRCVSAFDLLTIIGANKKFSNSKSITSIVKEIDSDNTEIFKMLGDLTKVPVSRKVMSKFMINCARLRQNQYLKQLREYILECEDYLSLKYVNWYKVTLGLITLDDEFESTILSEIKDRRIFIDTDKFKYGLEILYKDKSVETMFKKRLIDCGHKPQGFFDKLMGTISWDSYNDCFKCSENKCVVYLDENYKSFLQKKHKIRSIDKIKILIYVELRLRLFSKYIALEGLRITKKKFSKVKSILNKIYKDDSNRGKLHNNDNKQFVMSKIFGGSGEGLMDDSSKLNSSVDPPVGLLGTPPANAPESGTPNEPSSTGSLSSVGDTPSLVPPAVDDSFGAPLSATPSAAPLDDAQLGSVGTSPDAPATDSLLADSVTPSGVPPPAEAATPPADNPTVSASSADKPFGSVDQLMNDADPADDPTVSASPTNKPFGSVDQLTNAAAPADDPTVSASPADKPFGSVDQLTTAADPTVSASPTDKPFGSVDSLTTAADPTVSASPADKSFGSVDSLTTAAPTTGDPPTDDTTGAAPLTDASKVDAKVDGSTANASGDDALVGSVGATPTVGSPSIVDTLPKPGSQDLTIDSLGQEITSDETVAPIPKKEDTNPTDRNTKEESINSSSIIYLTYEDTKVNDFSEDQVDQLTEQRKKIALSVKQSMKELTGASSDETFKVYRVRFGPQTTSVEVVINITGDESLSEETIKHKIATSIVEKGDDNIQTKLFVTELDVLKDIYYDGISRHGELQSFPSQYKRVMLQLPGIYPITEKDRISFEERIINSIIEILGGSIEIERVHLERVSRVTNKNDEVVVQFLIMNGTPGSKTPNEILMEFKNNYNLGESDYSDKYRISNVVFGDPSIILDGSEVEIPNTLTEEKELVEEVDKATLNKLEGEYRGMAYYGCELTLEDLKNNLITSSTPLFSECESNIYQYFNGYMGPQ